MWAPGEPGDENRGSDLPVPPLDAPSVTEPNGMQSGTAKIGRRSTGVNVRENPYKETSQARYRSSSVRIASRSASVASS